ncbi:MAG: ribosome maturation factor RimP [Bacillota bacterium]|jgi:ribosome maturation factor RimP
MAKSASLDELTQVIKPVVEELGYNLIEVAWGSQFRRRTLTLYVDKPGGVLLEDCQLLSRQVGELLDSRELISGSYVLEVSSPGAERPLKRDRDFEYFTGRYVFIRTRNPLPDLSTTEVYGTLRGLVDGKVAVESEQGQLLQIPREEIVKARLAIKL